MSFNLNLNEYRDKVLGCWAGKNIGGTLGTPYEGDRNTHDIEFFRPEDANAPAPNDDLDLQLVWLAALERYGVQGITKERMAEMWMGHIIGPWGEYINCKLNIANGLYPPLSGSCNNEQWKYSNGAWIRSEIWACINPGMPDEAIRFAYIDSCVDHCGEGIYAEMFTAATEAAAFICNDIDQIIDIGLSKIPEECRVAKLIKLVRECHSSGRDWRQCRDEIVRANDLGWFQAPGNVAFAVTGLVFGEGDFGKSLCIAVDCGDDTDCSAGYVGALLGIISGYGKLPERWRDYIGNSIKTCALNSFEMWDCPPPKTIQELTARTVSIGRISSIVNAGTLPSLENAPTCILPEQISLCMDRKGAEALIAKSPYELEYRIPFGVIYVDYHEGPYCSPGESKEITVSIEQFTGTYDDASFEWILPDGWKSSIPEAHLISLYSTRGSIKQSLVPGAFGKAVQYVQLKVSLASRNASVILQVPFIHKDSVNYVVYGNPDNFIHDWNRWKNKMRDFKL